MEQLMALPLFQGLAEDLAQVLRFEVELCCDPAKMPAEVTPRPSYVRFQTFEPEEVLVRQGDVTTEFFAVLSGLITAQRAEPGEGVELSDSLEPGAWFGETSALSHQLSLATYRADEPSEVVALDARLFTKLYEEDQFSDERKFSTAIDERYREKSLVLHLRAAPLFAAASKEDLKLLRDGAEFCVFEYERKTKKPAILAEQGKAADCVYLLRGGAVACFVKDETGVERAVAYYMSNSSFGEHALATKLTTWPGTYKTMARTHAVKIPRAVFDRLREASPRAHRTLTHTANLLLGDDAESLAKVFAHTGTSGQRPPLGSDEIEIMVHRQSAKGGEALVIDQHKCIRCNLCVESCVAVHDDGVPRISKVGNKVSIDQVLITACYSCAIPECMLSCQHGAIRRDAQGLVRFVHDNCMGCSACIDGCPYGVIRMSDPQLAAPKPRGLSAGSLLRRLFGLVERAPEPVRSEGKLFTLEIGGEKSEVQGKTVKCDLCAGLPFQACVYNCPTTAITRRTPESLFRKP
jgi:Fe-S-cluster-containing dehydrogenase component/CRP-like cAMP-binding protein